MNMTIRRTALGRTAVSFIIVAIVVVGALALAEAYNIPPLQHTLTSSTTRTCTVIPAISFLYCGSPLRISAYGTPGASPFLSGDGSWNFTVSISSNSVARGESVLLVAYLTNIGLNQTIKEFI